MKKLLLTIGLCLTMVSLTAKQDFTDEFAKGFEAGVRYGLLAQMDDPNEDNIRNITIKALKIYLAFNGAPKE